MISTLVGLLGKFYARNDFVNFEAIARSIHSAIPNDQTSLQFIGLVYYRTGRVKDAIHIFDKVVRRRKARPTLEVKKGITHLCHGDYAAATCYLEATRHSTDLAPAWYDLGAALVELGKHEQAIPAFRSALIAHPEFTQAMLAIGQTALRVNDLVAAEEGFSRLCGLQPNNADAYRGLAIAYRKRRNFVTARACFAKVRMLQAIAPASTT